MATWALATWMPATEDADAVRAQPRVHLGEDVGDDEARHHVQVVHRGSERALADTLVLGLDGQRLETCSTLVSS